MSNSETVPNEPTPGKLLADARARAGLTQEQVATELKIQLKKIQALEDDNYHMLFSEVFARGYLRSCARLLGIDGEELVRLYAQVHGGQEAELPVNESLNLTLKSASPWPRRLLLVAIIIAVWAVSWWFFAERESAPEEVSAAAVEETPAMPREPAGVLEARLSPETVDSTTRTDDSAEEAVDQPVATPSEQENTLDTLELAFEQESWLEVQDAKGDALAAELQLAGSRLRLVGEAPFTVKLGNYAQGVSAWVNDEEQAMPDRASTAVATFELGTD